MPFCSTATRVSGPHSRASQGAADGVWCAFVHNMTQSNLIHVRRRADGTQRQVNHAIVPLQDKGPSGRRVQAMTSCRSAARSNMASAPPMPPMPTTAMVRRAAAGAEFDMTR